MTQLASGAGAGAGGAAAGGASASGASGSGAGAGTAAAGAAAGAGAGAAAGAAAAGGAAGAGAGAGGGSQSGGGQGAGAAGAGAAEGGAGAGAGSGAGAAAAAGAGTRWDENWREQYSGQDATKLNVLKRYASPQAALDALFAARQRIDSGEIKQPLAKDATPEQVTAWRKENGIPEKPEAYFDKLPDGVKLEDSDKAILAPYAQAMHELNLPPEVAGKLVAVRQQELEKLVDTRIQADNTLKTQTEDVLRGEWGNDYRANINNVHAMLDGAPPEVAESILNARTADGNPLVGTPETMRWLAQLARQLNPFGTIVGPTGGAMDGKGVEARIAEITAMMGKSNGPYYKGPQADALQKEFRDLVSARDRIKARTAA